VFEQLLDTDECPLPGTFERLHKAVLHPQQRTFVIAEHNLHDGVDLDITFDLNLVQTEVFALGLDRVVVSLDDRVYIVFHHFLVLVLQLKNLLFVLVGSQVVIVTQKHQNACPLALLRVDEDFRANRLTDFLDDAHAQPQPVPILVLSVGRKFHKNVFQVGLLDADAPILNFKRYKWVVIVHHIALLNLNFMLVWNIVQVYCKIDFEKNFTSECMFDGIAEQIHEGPLQHVFLDANLFGGQLPQGNREVDFVDFN